MEDKQQNYANKTKMFQIKVVQRALRSAIEPKNIFKRWPGYIENGCNATSE